MTLRARHHLRMSIRLLAVVACCALASGTHAQSPHPAVARIVVQEADGVAYGSGTLVDVREQYGLVATNWHVVRDAVGKIEVLFPDGFRSEARALKLDEDWDLAALVIWRPPTEPAPIARRAPRPGESLTICGYGQGEYRAATGRCTEYYAPKIGLPHELVELDVEARQGDSGGPIFNSSGELAGVLFGAGQGTTLGAFGGRVNAFLSTLASDIGPRPHRGVEPTEPATATPLPEAPAVIAVRPSPETAPRSTEPVTPSPEATEPIEPPGVERWASVGDDAPAAWTANTTPQINDALPTESSSPSTPRALFDDLKSIFALIGVGAVLLAVVKTIS